MRHNYVSRHRADPTRLRNRGVGKPPHHIGVSGGKLADAASTPSSTAVVQPKVLSANRRACNESDWSAPLPKIDFGGLTEAPMMINATTNPAGAGARKKSRSSATRSQISKKLNRKKMYARSSEKRQRRGGPPPAAQKLALIEANDKHGPRSLASGAHINRR